MIKALLTSALLLASIPFSASADTWEEHRQLMRSLRNVGVSVYINDPSVCSRNIDGRYWSSRRRLDVCQDNHSKPYVQVRWTQNDLDTLRHEAHHVIQDCMDTPFDGQLRPLFSSEEQWVKFVSNAMTVDQAKHILSHYPTDKGRTELEAFAVARTVSADTIANKLEEFCGV